MARDKTRLRLATKHDFKALINLEQISFRQDRFNSRRINYLLTNARSTILVLERNRDIVGAAYLLWRKFTSTGRIYNIAITPKLQGKGYGAILLERCELECRRRRCRHISLEVRIDNKPAIEFYKKHGFEIIGKLAKYYDDNTAGFKMLKVIS